MNTISKTTEQKKINQLVFVEYERPTKDGHFVTIVDSYRNTIGKIHKNYNEELKKYEYTAFDHTGNPLSKSEKLWELKNDFINNREQLLEQAHQRRIESNEKSKQSPEQVSQPVKAQEIKKDPEKRSQEKQNNKPKEKAMIIKENNKLNNPEAENQNRLEEREQELDDLRQDIDEDRGEFDMDR